MVGTQAGHVDGISDFFGGLVTIAQVTQDVVKIFVHKLLHGVILVGTGCACNFPMRSLLDQRRVCVQVFPVTVPSEFFHRLRFGDRMPQEEKLLDATGMDCARVILGLKKALIEINSGEILKVVATDPIAPKVLEGFTRQTRHVLLKQTQNGTAFIFFVQKT
jgi:tRNA 2-thiouridine synthesizing protein A